MLTARAYDIHLEQLFDRIRQLHAVVEAAGVPYRLVGGMAVYLHVFEQDPVQARTTADVDAAIRREHLPAVIDAAERAGLHYRHVAGVDMLVDAERPRARSSVHLVFVNEKVRPEYVDAVPSSPPDFTREGFLVAPVRDLVRMKLTSFRLKDKVHIQDLDGVGLITPEIESELPDVLRQRLAEVRASE
jgi:hypothetical protein